MMGACHNAAGRTHITGRGLAMPYLRVSRAQFDRATHDALAQLMPDLADAIQRVPGCQHYHGGLDRANGRAITMAVFDTAEHARYSRDLLGDIIPRLQEAGMRIEAPEVYEVMP